MLGSNLICSEGPTEVMLDIQPNIFYNIYLKLIKTFHIFEQCKIKFIEK